MQSGFAQEQQQFLEQNPGLESVDLLLVDLNGIVRGKRAPISALSKLASGGLVFPRGTTLLDSLGRAAESLPWGVLDGDPDRPIAPVSGSLTPAPVRPTTDAQVLVYPRELDDSAWFACPRSVLQRQLDALSRVGLVATVAVELEFYLFEPGSGDALVAAKGRENWPVFSGPQTYNLLQVEDHNAFISSVLEACTVAGIPATSLLSEYGNGQFEINLAHLADPMRACDHAILMRRVVKTVADHQNKIATFMAKPRADDSGNGLHIHVSLHRQDGSAVFDGTTHAPGAALRHAIAGTLQTLPASMALLGPNANSWRRFNQGFYAPTEASWGLNHRQVALRVPMSDPTNLRLEHRVAGADANPYLAMAAVLAGVLYGLEQKEEPPEAVADGALLHPGEPLPLRWREALFALRDATAFSDRLGAEFVAAYVGMKLEEEMQFHAQVGQVDLDHYVRTL